jgi:hypothetical protein
MVSKPGLLLIEAALFAAIALWVRSYRIDRRADPSLFRTWTENWQVFDSRNYTAAGKRFVPVLWLLLLAFVATAVFY